MTLLTRFKFLYVRDTYNATTPASFTLYKSTFSPLNALLIMLDIQRNGKIGSESREFNFWDEKRIEKYDKHANMESSDLVLQTKTSECDVYSPTFWATSTRHEASRLLQHNSRYTVGTPTSGLEVMVDDRRVLTNMVQNMPESSFELSLRDIVDDRTNMHAGEKKIEKKKCLERSKMVRSHSMDSGVFLLKMFLPACLSAKKKPITSGNCSRTCHRPSFDGSEKPMDKEGWSVMFLVSRRKINNCNSTSSSRSSGSIHNRNGDNCIMPAYLSSDHLSKSRRHVWSLC